MPLTLVDMAFNYPHPPRTALTHTHLSEDVTRQGLIQAGMAVDESKEVQAGAMLLHH